MLNEAEVKIVKERLEFDQSSATGTEGTILIFDKSCYSVGHLLLSEGRGHSGQWCAIFGTPKIAKNDV